MPTDLLASLNALKALLPDLPQVAAQVDFDFATTVSLPDGLPAFVQAAQVTGTPLLFVQWLHLTESDFAAPQDADEEGRAPGAQLQGYAPLAPFLRRLGEPCQLRVFFPWQGHRVEFRQDAPWWASFQDAVDEADELRRAAAEQAHAQASSRMKEESERRKTVLRERLPGDEGFIRLACEARPRITAMELHAGEVLRGVLGTAMITVMERETLREIASALREKHRPSRRRQG